MGFSGLWADLRLFLFQLAIIVGLYVLRYGTAKGVGKGLQIGFQILLFFLPCALFLRTTRSSEIMRGLKKVMPVSMVFIISTSLRFVPFFVREIEEIALMQRLRGASVASRDLINPRRTPIAKVMTAAGEILGEAETINTMDWVRPDMRDGAIVLRAARGGRMENRRKGKEKKEVLLTRRDGYFLKRFSLKDAIFLGFCATFIIITRTALRLHLNIPGHAMFFLCFFLILAVGCVPKMWTATLVGVASGTMALMLGMGQGGPFMLLRFIFPALIVDCARLLFPRLATSYVACTVVGVVAAASRFLTIVIPDLAAGMDWAVTAGHAVASTAMGMGFGGLRAMMVPAIVRRLRMHSLIEAG